MDKTVDQDLRHFVCIINIEIALWYIFLENLFRKLSMCKITPANLVLDF